jgi:hypothetical protein
MTLIFHRPFCSLSPRDGSAVFRYKVPTVGVGEVRFAEPASVRGARSGRRRVCNRLLAVQAQDLRSARLAVRARTRGLTAADVNRALTDERMLVVGWLNRGTRHLVRDADCGLLHAVTSPPKLTSGRPPRSGHVRLRPGA